MLTDSVFEFQVKVTKLVFEERVVLEFIIENTLEKTTLKEVGVNVEVKGGETIYVEHL